MMKIHDLFLYVALVGIVVIWSACSEDKGNYDYAALNEVSIDSIGTSYMREAGADIYINPGVRSLNEICLIHGQLTEKRCRRKKS